LTASSSVQMNTISALSNGDKKEGSNLSDADKKKWNDNIKKTLDLEKMVMGL